MNATNTRVLHTTVDDQPLKAIDIWSEIRSRNIQVAKVNAPAQDQQVNIVDGKQYGLGEGGVSLDWTQWLPAAAKVYNISPDIKDYIVVPVLTVPTDIPNRNGIAFPLKELLAFSPEDGMQYFKTWKGKPTFSEHDNQDHTKAKGVILDTHMRFLKRYNIGRVLKLLAFDRTRDPVLVQEILDRKRNSYSMGSYLSGYSCSICGGRFNPKTGESCEHVPQGFDPARDVMFYQQQGRLAFLNGLGPVGFETSSVRTPAWSPALNDNVIDMSQTTPQDTVSLFGNPVR